MKKVIIAVVVILAAALIGMKYFAAKKQPGMPQTGAAAVQSQGEQQGVSLPAGSTAAFVPSTEMMSFTPAQATGSYEMLALPPAALTVKGTCEGGSPKEILENHGKVWGYFTGRHNAFEPKKTQEIYGYIWDYYACMASARQDSSVCSELPGEVVKDGLKFGVPMGLTGAPMSPMEICRKKNVMFLFKAYVAGKSKDQQNCMDYLAEWDSAILARISPAEFCAAAAQGPDKLLAYGKEKMPEYAAQNEKAMAFSKKACGSSSDCLADFDLWEGIRTGNADKCPPAYRANCAALVQKSPAPCSSVLTDMSKKYCAYYKELTKHGGGYAGATPEDVQAALKQAAEKKKAEDLQRKQSEEAIKKVNETVRKLMGNKGEKSDE